MTLQDIFAACYIINLPERRDRRREMERELTNAGLTDPKGWAEFFPAVRPNEAGPFPTLGARGCFLSHLEVLQRADARGLPNVLVMEDDLSISPLLLRDSTRILTPLKTRHWDIVYFGHLLGDEIGAEESFREFTGPMVTTHFLAVNGPCVPRLIAFLKTVLSRPAGHPDGGPMYPDGAFNTFRQQNPDVVTLVSTRNLGIQRSSRSDVTPGWPDRVPVLRSLMSAQRTVRKWVKARR